MEWLILSEAQSITILAGDLAACRQKGRWRICRQEEVNCVHTGSILSIGDLKALHHSDTLPPTTPRLPIVLLPLGAIFFQTTTDCEARGICL